MKNSYIFLQCLFLIVVCLSLRAEASETYSLKDCARRGLENSYTLKSYEAQQRQSEEKTKEILTARNFKSAITGSSVYQQPEIKANLPLFTQQGTDSPVVVPNWYHSYSLTLTKVLTTFGKIESTADYYKMDEILTETKWRMEQDKILLDIATAYFSVVRSGEFLDIARAELELWRQQYQVSQSLFNRGSVAEYDLMNTRVNLARAKEHIITAEKDLEIAEGNLRTLMGIGENPRIDADSRLYGAGSEKRRPRREELAQILLLKNPALELARQSIRRQEYALEAVRRDKAPTLQFQTAYGRNTETFTSEDYSWKNTLSLNIPLGDGGEKRTKLRQTEEQILQAQLELADTRKNILWNLEQACLELAELEAKYETAREEVQAAAETSRVAQLRYGSGLGTIVEATDANRNLITARSKQKQLESQIRIQQAIMSYLCGTIYSDIMGEEQ